MNHSRFLSFQHSLQKENRDVILNIRPPMNKTIAFKQEKNITQAQQQKYRTCHHFSLVCTDYLSPQDLQPQKFIPFLKQLKGLKYLSIDIAYLLHISQYSLCKIFDSLKFLKGLSMVRLEIRSLSFLLQESNLPFFYKALPILNNLFRVQVKFSLHASEMTIFEGIRLPVLLESLHQLKRLTSVGFTFRSSEDIASVLEAVGTLKASKSLQTFLLTLEKCQLCPSNRLNELFVTLKEIKSLKYSKILFKQCDVPSYPRLKPIVPLLEEIGQNGAIKIVFNDCKHAMSRYERLLLTTSIKNIKASHKVQVCFISPFKFPQRLKSSCRKCKSECIQSIQDTSLKEVLPCFLCLLLMICVIVAIIVIGIVSPGNS